MHQSWTLAQIFDGIERLSNDHTKNSLDDRILFDTVRHINASNLLSKSRRRCFALRQGLETQLMPAMSWHWKKSTVIKMEVAHEEATKLTAGLFCPAWKMTSIDGTKRGREYVFNIYRRMGDNTNLLGCNSSTKPKRTIEHLSNYRRTMFWFAKCDDQKMNQPGKEKILRNVY